MMSQLLQVTLLGSPTITLGDKALTGLITGKALALFAYLAVNRQPHTRDHLADLLWSEYNNQQARNNLRYLLPDLRQPLVGYLTITPQTIGFNRQAPYQLDVERLQTTLAAQVIAAHQPNAALLNLPALQAALDLYQGKFLAGFTVRNAPVFEAWVRQQESEIHHLAVQGFYTLAKAYFQQEEIQAGLRANQQLLQWEPWHEAGHRLQMRLLMATGQRSAALTQYTHCRQLLADELGVEPEAATVALYEEIRAGAYDKVTRWQGEGVTSDRVISDRVTSRPEAGVHGGRSATQSPPHPFTLSPLHPVTPSLPHNLPGELTPFVGRTAEIEQLCALLTDSTHALITLTGLGGSGKTRLALAVAQRILDFGFLILPGQALDSASSPADNPKSKIKNQKFPDGVWFVPLIGVADGENLVDRLAVVILDTLQLPRLGPLAPVEQLLDALRDRSLLLILDNFEHLATGVDLLYTILQRATKVKLLVTSRQILNLQTEFVWQLEGLATPDVGAETTITPAEAQRYDGVVLFVERVQRVDRTFRLDEHNQADILQICRFVEGLPLGIELAAAMLRYYSCRELWQILHQDIRALVVTQRDLAPRHRSITALFDHSWRLLTPAQAGALATCSLFPQAFTLDAAAFIADATAEILFALIDHSLLRQKENGRFELHELVRQYAADQLQRQPQEAAHRRQRHVDYYSTLIEPDAEALMRRPEKLQLVQQELPNIRLAWLWCVEQQQLLPIMRLSEGIFLHAMAQGPLEEGWSLCNALVERLRTWPATPQNLAEARFFALAPAGLAYLGYYLGRYADVLQLAEEAIARAQPIMDRRTLAMAYSIKGMVAFAHSDFAAHEALCRTALTHAHAEPIAYMIAVNWAFLGLGLAVQGRLTEARLGLEEALELVQEKQLIYLEGYLLSELGFVYAMTGDWALADGTTLQALDLGQGLNNAINRGYQYAWLAQAAEAVGDYPRAVAWTEQALAFSVTVPDPLNQLTVLLVRGRALRYLGNNETAELASQQLLMLAQGLGRPTECAQAELELGHVALAQQQWQKAERQYHAALAIVTTGQSPCQAAAQAGLAQVQWQQKQCDNALAWVEQCQQLLLTQALESQYDAAFAAITCYQLLATVHDGRAATILQRAYDWVTAQSLKISDENSRRSFLTKAPYHRQLLDLVQTTGAGTAESTSNPP